MATMAEALRVAHGRGTARPAEEARERESAAKNILLFLAAPWIGLAYIIVFPFVGWAVLAKAVLVRK